MAARNYLDFDVRIERGGERYRVRVSTAQEGEAAQAFDWPFAAHEVEKLVARVRPSGRRMRTFQSEEVAAAKELGGRLFEAVFAGDVRGRLTGALDEADRQAAGLRIRLRLADVPELANLPWELLYNAGLNRFLALSADTPLVRYLELPERIRPLAVKPPLRILTMIAQAPGYGALDVDAEWQRLRGALADLEQADLVALDLLPQATLSSLRRALRQREYHIFHFIGHGAFDPVSQDGVLLMCGEDGCGRAVGSQELGAVLHDFRSLRLAVLNACEGARAAEGDPFAGVAQELVRQRLPAVIAMQFEISDEAAVKLSHEFYQALAEGAPVDAALAQARQALYDASPDVEWGTPVLYLRAPDGRLFDVAALTPEERRRIQQIKKNIARAEQAAAAGDWAAARGAWKAVLNLDPQHPTAAAGYEEAVRQRRLAELAEEAAAARQRNDPAALTAALEEMIGLDPGNADAIIELETLRERLQKAARQAEQQRAAAAEQKRQVEAAAAKAAAGAEQKRQAEAAAAKAAAEAEQKRLAEAAAAKAAAEAEQKHQAEPTTPAQAVRQTILQGLQQLDQQLAAEVDRAAAEPAAPGKTEEQAMPAAAKRVAEQQHPAEAVAAAKAEAAPQEGQRRVTETAPSQGELTENAKRSDTPLDTARAASAPRLRNSRIIFQRSLTASILKMLVSGLDRFCVWSVAWSPDGRQVAIGATANQVWIVDAAGSTTAGLLDFTAATYSVAWSPDGRQVASGTIDCAVCLWDADSGKLLRTLEGHNFQVLSVAWSPDGRRLASGEDMLGSIRLWDADSGESHLLLAHAPATRSVAWSPDGQRLASGGDDKLVCLWDPSSEERLLTLKGHAGQVNCVAWSPDGQQVASGSSDRTVRLWDAASGAPLLTLVGHTAEVRSVAWSPDGQQVASGAADRTVRLWGTAGGEVLLSLKGHSDSVNSVAWSPDGRSLASGGTDGTVRVWEVG